MRAFANILKRHPYRSVSAVLLLVAGVVAAAMISGGLVPGVINEKFSSTEAEASFSTLGNGNWQVAEGMYKLSQVGAVATSTFVGNASMSIYDTPITVKEWRLKTNAKALSTTTIHDFSVIFDYIDEANYYYANFSDKAGSGFNGVYQIAAGKQKLLAGFSSTIVANRVYEIEIRKEKGAVKIYRSSDIENRKFLAKVKTATYSSMKVGYGSRGGAAVFDNLVVTGTGKIATPTPTPSPEPKPDPKPTPAPTPTPPPAPTPGPTPTPTPSGGRIVTVSTSPQLVTAISNAQPGDVIKLADGLYDGSFIDNNGKLKNNGMVAGDYTGSYAMTRPGTAAKPITLEGSPKAVIDGGGTGRHYGLYLRGADYWRVKGLTITNATKGIVVDRSQHVILESLDVHTVGQEGIHLRDSSSDNIVRNNRVWQTGLKNATYGEGIYVGSANSNWGRYSGGQPDRSDRNQLLGNAISQTGAENMDIKEGTTGGLIQDNSFDGLGMTGSWADSWIDMKGNNWTIKNNVGRNAKLDGFQVHGALKGWGNNNTFSSNTAEVNADGFGFWLQNNVTGNTISCNNTVKAAKSGFATVGCQ